MTSRTEYSLRIRTLIAQIGEAGRQTPVAVRRVSFLSFALVFSFGLAGLLPGSIFSNPASALAYSVPAQTAIGSPISGVVGGGGAAVWDEKTGDLVTDLSPGAAVVVYTRSDDDKWLFVEDEQLLAGWTPSEAIIIVRSSRLPSEDVTIEPVTPMPQPLEDPQSAAIESGEMLTATETVSTTLATVILEDSRLNVRSGAGSEHPIIAKALPGDSYVVLGESGDGSWIQIELSRADDDAVESGWVSSLYVSLGDGDASMATPATLVNAVKTNADSKASSSMPSAAPAGLSGKLVFQNRGGDGIYLYNLDSGTLSLLTTGIDPALSPDGSQVVFTRSNNENGVYIINVDGSNEHLIFGERDWLRSPKWSPDGKRIVFVRGDELLDCYLLSDGRCMEIEWLNANKPGIDLNTLRKTKERKFHLARVDVDGSNYRDLVTLSTAKTPDWNSGGIVYQSRAGIQITQDWPEVDTQLVYFDILKQYHHDPDWQPNGGQILFDQREASHWEIYTINPDGSGRRALTRPEFTLVDELPSNATPAWSPDGRHIVFLSNREANHEAGDWRIWVMNADGSNQRPLPINVSIEYGFDSAQMVDWGP